MGYANVDFVYPLNFNKIHSEHIKIYVIYVHYISKSTSWDIKNWKWLSSPLPQMLVAGNKLWTYAAFLGKAKLT